MTDTLASLVSDVTARRQALLRPQTVLLVLLALAPYDGPLLLVPQFGFLDGWKVALVALSLGLALLERPARPAAPATPRWFMPMVLLLAVSLVSVLMHPTWQSVVGFRISYVYLLVPLVLWWSPFDATDRDRFVTTLMVNGIITSVVGIAQQVIGADALHDMGYAYNEVIRTSGGFLRSFSTFNQPFPFAFFVMAVLLVGIPVALEDRARIRNRLFLIAIPLMLVGMGTAIVRGAILGLVVGLIYLGAVRYRVLAHALVPLPVIILLLVSSSVGGALLSSSSLGQRTTGWVGELTSSALRPFGQGIGSTGATAEMFETQGKAVDTVLSDSSGGPQRYQADNYYVKMLVELGPIGLWLFAWVVLAAARDGHRVSRSLMAETGNGSEARDRGLAFGIAGATVGAIAAALVATYWEVFPADLLFWACLGVLPSLRNRSC